MGLFSSLFGGHKGGGGSMITFPAPPPPPPKPLFLRPVESQITDILLRRSRGEDVGFDPRRLALLKETFDIDATRAREEALADIHNALSGTGQSRNLAAREALMGRTLRDLAEQRRKTFAGFDIEDLATRQQERDVNTARLQALNEFNFGQENAVAQHGLGVFNTQTQQALAQAAANQAAAAQDSSGGGGFGGIVGDLLGSFLPSKSDGSLSNISKLLGLASMVPGPQQPVLAAGSAGTGLAGAFRRRGGGSPLFVSSGHPTNFFPTSLRNAPLTRFRLGGF